MAFLFTPFFTGISLFSPIKAKSEKYLQAPDHIRFLVQQSYKTEKPTLFNAAAAFVGLQSQIPVNLRSVSKGEIGLLTDEELQRYLVPKKEFQSIVESKYDSAFPYPPTANDLVLDHATDPLSIKYYNHYVAQYEIIKRYVKKHYVEIYNYERFSSRMDVSSSKAVEAYADTIKASNGKIASA
jgi:hypothetical protein